MKLHLKELFDIEGEKKEVDYRIEPDELEEYSSYEFKTPIVIKGEAKNRAGIVTLVFNTRFSLHHVCDRCLKEFEREYDYDFLHTLVRSVQRDNDEYVVCKDNVLELNELAISDLILQLPTKILCREDCKGLCYKCGQDLNEGSCNCSEG